LLVLQGIENMALTSQDHIQFMIVVQRIPNGEAIFFLLTCWQTIHYVGICVAFTPLQFLPTCSLFIPGLK